MSEISRLVVLDQDEAARKEAVEVLSALFPQAEIVEAASQRELQASWTGPAPELALIGLALADETGLDAARRIRQVAPACRIVLCAPGAPESVRAGAATISCALIAAPASADKIVAALDGIAAEQALSDRAAAALAFA